MATPWQKSCIEALITSPIAFKLFKIQQRNVKAMDQYIGRCWAYAKESQKEGSLKLINTLEYLIECIEATKKSDPVHMHGNDKRTEFDAIEMLKAIFDAEDAGVIVNETRNESRVEFYLMDNNGNNESKYVGENKKEKTILFAIKGIISDDLSNYEKENHCTKLRAISVNNRDKYDDFVSENVKQIENLIKLLARKKQKQNKRKNKKTVGTNIGIEIEYEGCNMQHLEKDLLKLGAVSFHSGWDGSTKDGHEQGSRLRECRLRLESWKSLPALFLLLEKMIELGCSITQNSGMHYHVDLRYKKRWNDFYRNMGRIGSKIEGSLYTSIKRVYELETNERFEEYFWERLNKQSDFKTAEWRMGSQTLNYKKLVLQILVAIHITDAITQNIMPNESYIKMLAECCVKKESN